MNATRSVIDLDDVEGLLAADREGLLRAAAMSGAHVRAVAAAVEEGALEQLAGPRPRTVVWVAGRGVAGAAGGILAALLGDVSGQPLVVASGAPPWIGPLDVVVLAGDDPADPALTAAATTAVHRGARVVVAAPYEGPLRDATAARAAVLAPRLPVNDAFVLCRYLAAGVATVGAVDPGLGANLDALADQLDAEALRSGAGREFFTNPAKLLAERMTSRQVVFAGDSATTLALAHHGSAVLLRLAGEVAASAGLADVVVPSRAGVLATGPGDSLFYDEEIDGPAPDRIRVFALALNSQRPLIAARVTGLDDVDVIAAEDIPDATAGGVVGVLQQIAVLAVRLEMAAVFVRLVRG